MSMLSSRSSGEVLYCHRRSGPDSLNRCMLLLEEYRRLLQENGVDYDDLHPNDRLI